MEANVRAEGSSVVCSPHLAELPDGDLLAGTRRLVGASNHLLANLLAHLAEVEARGIHRTRACSSLYTYCVYELRFSEDAAFRRVSAARLVRRFPALFDAIASGELHLTAVLMLGPHLTPENVVQVLARAKHRTKREIGQLVRELDPVPDVPARIEPLGPAPANGPQPLRRPTWEMFVRSFNPVRHLTPGERPRDWMNDALSQLGNDSALPTEMEMEIAGEGTPWATSLGDGCEGATAVHGAALARDERTGAAARAGLADAVAPARLKGPQRYSVQFTATAEHVELVERARALLAASREGASLAQVHLRAMRELVAVLEKRKYGVGARPRGSRQSAVAEEESTRAIAGGAVTAVGTSERGGGDGIGRVEERGEQRWAGEVNSDELMGAGEMNGLDEGTDEGDNGQGGRREPDEVNGRRELEGPGGNEEQGQSDDRREGHEPRDEERGRANDQGEGCKRTAGDEIGDRENETCRDEEGGAGVGPLGEKSPRWRGRHVPAAVRREVFARDAGRCGYVDGSGNRCRETSWLELHHLRPFARGGEHSVANLALRCRAHNALAAEDDFGRELVDKKRGSVRHESFSHAQRGRREGR